MYTSVFIYTHVLCTLVLLFTLMFYEFFYVLKTLVYIKHDCK